MKFSRNFPYTIDKNGQVYTDKSQFVRNTGASHIEYRIEFKVILETTEFLVGKE